MRQHDELLNCEEFGTFLEAIGELFRQLLVIELDMMLHFA
jgi:hypothetical protein